MADTDAAIWPRDATSYRVEVAGRSIAVAVAELYDGLYVKLNGGEPRKVEISRARADGELSLLLGNDVVRGLVRSHEGGVTVMVDGESVDAVVLDERAARLASSTAARARTSETAIRAPMPGLVVGINVEAGESVAKGTTLVVLSAMKMQNELTAPADGTVKEILVSTGQTVDQNQVLVRIE